jgi:Anti-sigma-K factor rskA
MWWRRRWATRTGGPSMRPTMSGWSPQPAGTFGVDEAGAAVVGIAPTGGAVDVFAITLEPAGGVPAPTGPIVLASAR